MALIWLIGSTTDQRTRPQVRPPWEKIHWRRWERCVLMKGSLKSDAVVRSSIEESLKGYGMRKLCKSAERTYEHSAERDHSRSGDYKRKLESKAGEVTLKILRLKRLPFDLAIIDAIRGGRPSVEEALVKMYLTGVSARRVEDITEAILGHPGELRNSFASESRDLPAPRRRRRRPQLTSDYRTAGIEPVVQNFQQVRPILSR